MCIITLGIHRPAFPEIMNWFPVPVIPCPGPQHQAHTVFIVLITGGQQYYAMLAILDFKALCGMLTSCLCAEKCSHTCLGGQCQCQRLILPQQPSKQSGDSRAAKKNWPNCPSSTYGGDLFFLLWFIESENPLSITCLTEQYWLVQF